MSAGHADDEQRADDRQQPESRVLLVDETTEKVRRLGRPFRPT
jgi:hypothetical protein